jgi:DNA end-binding protein Ku
MRAIWSGAVSFGLVSVPVKLYTATSSHDVRFHQVHAEDGGRIRYKRVCTVDGQEVEYADIVKGFETEDGELVTLDEADLESLPQVAGHEINVIEFVPADQIDPLLFDKSYFLEPETKAVKPYALLREALRETDRMAVVKFALRQRENMALLRVRDDVIVLQTMLWPDEVRQPEFDILETDVELRPQEMQMAASLVDSLGADFDPSDFHDDYRDAVLELIERKRTTGEARTAPVPAAAAGDTDSMTDLLTALQRSVEAARGGSEEAEPAADTGAKKTPARKPAAKKPATKKPAAKKPAAQKAGAQKAGAQKATGTEGAAPRKRSRSSA